MFHLVFLLPTVEIALISDFYQFDHECTRLTKTKKLAPLQSHVELMHMRHIMQLRELKGNRDGIIEKSSRNPCSILKRILSQT